VRRGPPITPAAALARALNPALALSGLTAASQQPTDGRSARVPPTSTAAWTAVAMATAAAAAALQAAADAGPAAVVSA
jgi:hypothetical protein